MNISLQYAISKCIMPKNPHEPICKILVKMALYSGPDANINIVYKHMVDNNIKQ